jgi:multidrug resistance efflux pump
MTHTYRQKKMRLPFRLVLKRLANACFLLLILGLVPFFLGFLTQAPELYRFNGLVESESENVGPVENARVLAVEVQPGQRVNAGDVLVRLDPTDRATDRAVDRAMNEARLKDYEQSVLRYEQDAARHRQDLQDSERRCRRTVREAAVALESEKMNRARDAAELAGLKAEIARLQPLVDRRLVSETELSRLRPSAEALEKSVAQYGPLIDALEQQHAQAAKDSEEIRALLAQTAAQGTPADPVLTAVRQAAETCKQASAMDGAVLKASRSGVVSRVLRQAGDVVVAGEPVVRVASSSALYITGMLTQRQLQGLAVGDRLKVTRASTAPRKAALTAQVEVVEPEVMDLLDPFNPAPRFPLRGRRARLRVLDETNDLVPGETVALESNHRETWLEGIKRICQLGTAKGGQR